MAVLDIFIRGKGGEQTKNELKKVNKAGSETTKIFKTLGTMLSVGILAKGIQSSIKAYAKQEVAVTKLNAALKATGRFTEETSKKLQDNATAMQAVTTFGDETILAVEAMLATFKLAPDTIIATTKATLDMAAATGTDAVAAAILMGKAAVGEIGTLSRYGIIVDKAALKTKGFAAVLEEINSEFGGTAEAIAKSGIGPMEQFKNTMGDVSEIIGESIVPALNNMIATYRLMEEIISGHNKKMEESADVHKRVTQLLQDENTEEQTRIQLLRAIKDGNDEMLKVIVKRSDKEKKSHDLRIEMSEVWKKKLEEEVEKERKLAEKRTEKGAKEIEERYNFRRELRELDLEEVITALEQELLSVSGNEEKKKALYLALDNYKKDLRVQEAVEIEAMNDKVTELFVSGTKDWGSAWQSFRDFVVDFILRDIASELVKTIGLGKVLKTVLGGATGGGFIGAVGGLLGFQKGGTVPGPIGKPRAAIVHGGEKWTPPGGAGNEVVGGRIEIHNHFHGLFLEADETKWSRMFREKVYPEMQRMLRKTGEQFSGS